VKAWRGVIEEYRDFLPVSDKTPIVSLFEGNTPLVPAPRLAEATDARMQIYLKCEGFNPTGSFKDRGMTVAISKALETGSRAVICASTGNTSASAAAFAARAGLRAFVMVPKGSVALGKLSQAAIHGAKVLLVDGSFDQALTIVRQIAERHPVTLVNSVNPFRLEGQKTGAFEVCDQLGRAPDYHLIPVGNAGNITAYWRGYREYHRAGTREGAAANGRLPGGGRRADLREPGDRGAAHGRDRDQDRQPRVLGPGAGSDEGFAGLDRHRHRRGDSARLPAPSHTRKASSWNRRQLRRSPD
jgi:threonine synthase